MSEIGEIARYLKSQGLEVTNVSDGEATVVTENNGVETELSITQTDKGTFEVESDFGTEEFDDSTGAIRYAMIADGYNPEDLDE